MSTISLRLPESLHKSARELAKKEKVSNNQLVTLALAEKVSALGAEDYLEQRAKRASQAKFEKAMAKVADIEPADYDYMDKLLSPIHPGEILLEDFVKPLGLSQYRLAQDIGVSPIRVSQIIRGQRSITVDTAMRLARYFGTSAGVWLRLQVRYDLEAAETELSERIQREVKVLQQPVAPQPVRAG